MSSERTPDPLSSPESAGQPIYVVHAPDQEHRIDLIALVKVIWKRRWLIAGVTFLFAAAGVTYAFVATPVYQAECVLVPNKSAQVPNFSAGLGGLASLAGINLGVSPDRTDAIATLRSRVFAEEFIRENDLMPVLFADKWDGANERWIGDDPDDWPDIRDGVQFFVEELRSIDEDLSTGLVTLTIEWTDPELAAEWVEVLVQRVNEGLRTRDLASSERKLVYLHEQLEQANLVELRQAISRLIEIELQTMAQARAEIGYAFKVIDPPRVPIEHVAPRKLSIFFLASALGSMIGVSLALLLGWATITHHEGATYERG